MQLYVLKVPRVLKMLYSFYCALMVNLVSRRKMF
jgi:hypothetical protein